MIADLAKRRRQPHLSAMSDMGQPSAEENVVRRDFWTKVRRTLGKVPFTEDAVAAFHCAADSATPAAVRTTLFGALAYFVLPFDAVPDFLVGLGFTDDAAVLLAAFAAARAHITEGHRQRARDWLLRPRTA